MKIMILRIAFTCLGSFFTSLCFPLISNAQCTAADRAQDSLALVALYNATDGVNWNSPWDLQQPMNAWLGVGVSAEGCVIDLFLDGSRNLNGTIPAEIGNLTNINNNLWVVNNPNVTGTIPSSIGNLNKLNQLFLFGNNLTGSIPASIGNMATLSYIDFCCNNLTGAIPNTIGNLNKLTALVLNENSLSGSLPGTLSNMSSLESLYLINNQISGPIPADIGNITTLKTFHLFNNHLSGSIPASMGNLTHLEMLVLSSNDLSGCLPAQLKNICSNVTNVDLYGNPNLATQSWLNFCNNDEGLCTTAAEYPEESLSTRCFPVPVKDLLNVQIQESAGPLHFEIINMNGQKILEREENSDQSIRPMTRVFDLSSFPAGTYLLTIRSKFHVEYKMIFK